MSTIKCFTVLIAVVLGAVLFACGSRAEEAERKTRNEDDKTAAPLFNGKDLGKWKAIDFGWPGDVHVASDGSLTLEPGVPLTGVVWTGENEKLPRSNYEISLEGKKHMGDDFFCALTFPVKNDHATFVCGGWGGTVVGISSIDGDDAVQNETTKSMSFEDGRWYRIRVRVTDDRMKGWIDDKQMFDVALEGKSIDLRPGQIELCKPLGIANYASRSAFRKIELRRLKK